MLLNACDKELVSLTVPETLLQEATTGAWVYLHSDSKGTVRSTSGPQ